MVVGEDQAVRRSERPCAAASAGEDAHRSVLQSLEIRWRQLDAVLLGDGIQRQLLDPPHPLVGRDDGDGRGDGCGKQEPDGSGGRGRGHQVLPG